MTPKQVTTINLNDLKEVELKCECGASVRLPLPLKQELPKEQECVGCPRKLWAYDSPVRDKLVRVLASLGAWRDAGYTTLGLSFVLTETL